ncbi:TadE/TadG family type IV pilus assembly protein [Sphingomonas sp. 3-13AW]|uniref:TadE/TadG family type IV pilus assembly protein n=1 Tax=Sphingomonas sp. 3-13AW TaxID=3050450 RepID=UPI003BB6D9FD
MESASDRVAGLLCDLGTKTRGVSLIEFAIGLPVFLVAILGGLEVANMAITQQKVAGIASEVAANAARGTNQIDEADISQVMTGARLAAEGTPILSKGRVILSSVRLNAAKNGQWIEWQRCEGEDRTIRSAYGAQGKGRTDTSLRQVGPAPGLKAADGVNIMVVEVQTRYQPLIGNAFSVITEGNDLRAVSAHVVRDRNTFSIKNDGGVSSGKIKTC